MYHPASPSTLDTTNTTEATQCQSTPSNPMYTLCTTHGGWWYSVWFPGHNIQSDSCNVTTPPGMSKISCRLGCFVPPPPSAGKLASDPLWPALVPIAGESGDKCSCFNIRGSSVSPYTLNSVTCFAGSASSTHFEERNRDQIGLVRCERLMCVGGRVDQLPRLHSVQERR